jgi:hypothetical protein
MEMIEKTLATQRIQRHREGHGSFDMEARMTRAETTIEHILKDLEDIKRELRDLRGYVDERFREFEARIDARFAAFEASMRTEFRLVWAGMFTIAGLLAKGFHWI